MVGCQKNKCSSSWPPINTFTCIVNIQTFTPASAISIKQTRWYRLLILSTRPTVTSKPKRSPALAGIKL